MTDDSDTFVFGASCVIRNFDIKNDVTVFTAAKLRATTGVHLTQGGMLLIALLSGGVYDMANSFTFSLKHTMGSVSCQVGLPRCGEATAFKLSWTGLGDSLLDAALQLSTPALTTFLVSWRDQLRCELSTNKSGFLRRRLTDVACSVHDNFPCTDIILQYARPATSWSDGRSRPDTSVWVPQLPHVPELVALCERSFAWRSLDAITSVFRRNVWEGCCIQRLAQGPQVPPWVHSDSVNLPLCEGHSS